MLFRSLQLCDRGFPHYHWTYSNWLWPDRSTVRLSACEAPSSAAVVLRDLAESSDSGEPQHPFLHGRAFPQGYPPPLIAVVAFPLHCRTRIAACHLSNLIFPNTGRANSWPGAERAAAPDLCYLAVPTNPQIWSDISFCAGPPTPDKLVIPRYLRPHDSYRLAAS